MSATGPRRLPPRVSAARRLLKRSFREADRRFLVEGPQAVREALACGAAVELFVTADAERHHPDLLGAAAEHAVTVHRVGSDAVAALSGTVTPQHVVAVAHFVDRPLHEVVATSPRLVVLLAQVRDPGNAGTVVRAADAAGADAVVLSAASVDPYNGKCVRASAGSLFHLPVVLGVEVAAAVGTLRAAGLRVLAADGSGPTDLDRVADDGGLSGPTAWLFGNEAWGLPAAVRDLADAVVRIPIHGRAESLNLGAAAAVCLYASAREQRHSARG